MVHQQQIENIHLDLLTKQMLLLNYHNNLLFQLLEVNTEANLEVIQTHDLS